MTDCPHCPDGHREPGSKPMAVTIGPERDSDDQPTTLHVTYTAGHHVSEAEAQWLRDVLSGASATREWVRAITAGTPSTVSTDRCDAGVHAGVSWTYMPDERARESLLQIRRALKEPRGWWQSQDQADYEDAVPDALAAPPADAVREAAQAFVDHIEATDRMTPEQKLAEYGTWRDHSHQLYDRLCDALNKEKP